METATRFKTRPVNLEETKFRKSDGALVAGKVYIVRGFLSGPKYDYLLLEDDTGNRFKAFLNTCQRIDGVLA